MGRVSHAFPRRLPSHVVPLALVMVVVLLLGSVCFENVSGDV